MRPRCRFRGSAGRGGGGGEGAAGSIGLIVVLISASRPGSVGAAVGAAVSPLGGSTDVVVEAGAFALTASGVGGVKGIFSVPASGTMMGGLDDVARIGGAGMSDASELLDSDPGSTASSAVFRST